MAKSKKQRSLTSLIVMVFMAIFLTVVSVNFVLQMDTYKELKAEEIRIQAQVEYEKLQNLQLNAQKEYYNSDAYIEKIAREQLGLIKSNEVIFINRAKK